MLMALLFACICIYLQSNSAASEGEVGEGLWLNLESKHLSKAWSVASQLKGNPAAAESCSLQQLSWLGIPSLPAIHQRSLPWGVLPHFRYCCHPFPPILLTAAQVS